ncbi:Vi polysaccharide export inner membrane protein VexD [Phaeobacter sp. CECT 5382]|uniref:sugar transporter n=1 Tax=Phaeobacter sp. CECT 5382 TaxID=1712645 RepID=UPI0006DA7B7C|nr:sugar transporter [Phaeobacter sp. CECT 5382]CUH89361.1 Vi polysaccharide export inner membrane protein VexD [Phaeobacter sp. CECT 5382]
MAQESPDRVRSNLSDELQNKGPAAPAKPAAVEPKSDNSTNDDEVSRNRARGKAQKTRRDAKSATSAAAPKKDFALAGPAQMKRRHWGVVGSFVLLVLAPLAAVIFYLVVIAEDQYVSTAGFTVRSQENSSASDFLGGLASFAGTTSASDSDILYAFIQSQEMVEAVDEAIDLRVRYSAHWPRDWAFSIWPDATLEELIWYWQRIVSISYDSGSGLIEVQAVGFDAQVARAITQTIVDVSQVQINALNERAREDAMGYARIDLDEAVVQLKAAREELTKFRTRTRIVDPEADIQGRMGVMNNLQQQLAEALIEHDLLEGTVSASDPRTKKSQQRIEVIRARIDSERQTFTSDNTDTGAVGEDYPSLISEFESLSVDREYAEETYRAALRALEVARDNATRQSRYLATYIKPTLAEESEYPRRPLLMGLTALFLVLGWSIATLIYYSIRDRS